MGAGTLKACHIIAQGETLGENPGKDSRPNPHYERRETREKDREEAFAYDSRFPIYDQMNSARSRDDFVSRPCSGACVKRRR